MNKKPLGYWNYTVALTYIGMFCGFAGITNALYGRIFVAVLFLMLAGFFDMFDGAVASTKKDRTPDERLFGVQIDSLSDLICFGILPAMLVYRINCDRHHFYVGAIFGAFYVLCALVRLAYFNVDETNRQAATTGGREIYYGLPVTSSALIIPIVLEIAFMSRLSARIAGLVVLVGMGILFLSPFKLKKPHTVGKVVMIAIGIVEIVLLFITKGCMV